MKNIIANIFIISLIAMGCNGMTSNATDSSAPTDNTKTTTSVVPDADATLTSLRCSKDDIRTKVNSVSLSLQACYENQLVSNPNLAGRIDTQFTISSTGKVSSAKVTNSTLNNTSVEQCVVDTIQNIGFEVPSSPGQCVVNWPFVFSSIDEYHE
tara:strand:+ start:6245 stop:6706 length:462 start_codon:yes stop_codon:yes gene_type:complete